MGITVHSVWEIAVLAFVATAAVADLWWRKIPRQLTMTGLAIGLIYHFWQHDFMWTAVTALFAFLIGLALFSIGAIGGGDVKLITALAAMMGFPEWAMAMKWAIFAAAGMALFQVVRHRAVMQTILNIGTIFRSLFTLGLKAHPVVNVRNEKMIRSPFGVAAAVGTIIAVLSV